MFHDGVGQRPKVADRLPKTSAVLMVKNPLSPVTFILFVVKPQRNKKRQGIPALKSCHLQLGLFG